MGEILLQPSEMSAMGGVVFGTLKLQKEIL
jgi:hypothetical protein